ncbi:MAG: hypothetical protein SPD43_02840 [Candidatus Enterosoma sp.]|nr:hypothetical protein [Candidatus Enterosoma sp.]
MLLDYRYLLSSGLFTVIYIAFLSLGKISFSYVGAKITKSEDSIKKYFGLTLLPHSGVSLLFTGISINFLTVIDPCLSSIIQGMIASAAVINEIIVVLLAKFALQKAHEIPGSKEVASIRKQETESSF